MGVPFQNSGGGTSNNHVHDVNLGAVLEESITTIIDTHAATKMADQWRIHTNFSVNSITPQPVTLFWEQNDSTSFTNRGTSLGQASGVFSFPSTGIYLISYNFQVRNINNHNVSFVGAHLEVTEDGGTSWTTVVHALESFHQLANSFAHMGGSYIFDVTNTGTHLFRFVCQSSAQVLYAGSTNDNNCYVTVVQLL